MEGKGQIIFYIIVILVSLVFNYLKKKNQQQNPVPDDSPENPLDPFDPFKEIFKENIPAPEPVIQTPKQTEPKKPAVVPVIPKPQPSVAFSGDLTNSTNAQANISDETPAIALEFEHDDLKKAIIYSEILNRKY